MALNNVVLLVGGVGGAKLAYGLAQVLPPENLTIIVNTGDDFWLYGLRICPDIDTIMYTLSGLVNRHFGWGVADDTRQTLSALARYGQETWFGLGDQDFATHILRTAWLSEGQTLTDVTRRLTSSLGILSRVLPMTDETIATVVETAEFGTLAFQEYFVKHRWQPVMTGLRFSGAEQARMTMQVQVALAAADAIILGPSNPWLSIAPILAVPGMRAALLACAVPRVAVTPIVGGEAIKGPTAKLMRELGYVPSAAAVAQYYGSVINGFVYDERDSEARFSVECTAAFDTVMHTDDDKVVLAKRLLAWIEGWKS